MTGSTLDSYSGTRAPSYLPNVERNLDVRRHFSQNPQRIETRFHAVFPGSLGPGTDRARVAPPEQRSCKRPTTEQILRLFSLAQRHTLMRNGRIAQIFPAELTDLQRQVLALLDVPEDAFRT